MISYYDLLGLVQQGKEPKFVNLHLIGRKILFVAKYDGDSFSHYEIANKLNVDENFYFYLADCLLENEMFDKKIEKVNLEREFDDKFDNLEKKLNKLDKLSYQQIGKWFVHEPNALGILIDDINKQNSQMGVKVNEMVAHIRNLEKKVEDLENDR